MARPFDEELGRNQDDEDNYRLRKLGSPILLASDVKSDSYSRTSLRSLWRQYFQYGYYKVCVMQKHIGQMQLRQFIPPVFVIGLFAVAIGAPLPVMVRGLWLFMLLTYGAAILAASMALMRRSGWSRPWLLSRARFRSDMSATAWVLW